MSSDKHLNVLSERMQKRFSLTFLSHFSVLVFISFALTGCGRMWNAVTFDEKQVVINYGTYYLYGSDYNGNSIYGYTIDANTGTATGITTGSPYSTGGNPFEIAVDGLNRFIYTDEDNGGQIDGFSIDATTGILTEIPGMPTGSSESGICADPTGKFVFTTMWGGHQVHAYAIDQTTGFLTSVSGSPYGLTSSGHGCFVDPSGQYLYVATPGANAVSGYTINSSGQLTAMAGSPFATGFGVFSVATDPSSRFLYAVNPSAGQVAGFTIGAGGVLAAIAGSPFATGVTGTQQPIRVDPSGNFVAIPTAGSTGVVLLKITQGTGALTALAPVNTSCAGNGGISIDPLDRFLIYSCTLVDALTLSATTGDLTPVSLSPPAYGGANSIGSTVLVHFAP